LWHGRAAELRAIAKNPALETRLLVLERFLLTIAQPLKRHAVVDFALREFGELPKAACCANAYPNSWHSDRSNRIQHSPFQSTLPRSGGADSKLFCRVRRLQQVLNLLAGKTQVDWADIVFSCGYSIKPT